MDNNLTLEKLKIADRLSSLERRFDILNTQFEDKMNYVCKSVDEIKIQVNAVDRNANLQDMNLQKRLGDLPCCVHKNELKWIKGGLYTVYVFVMALIIKAIHSWIQVK